MRQSRARSSTAGTGHRSSTRRSRSHCSTLPRRTAPVWCRAGRGSVRRPRHYAARGTVPAAPASPSAAVDGAPEARDEATGTAAALRAAQRWRAATRAAAAAEDRRAAPSDKNTRRRTPRCGATHPGTATSLWHHCGLPPGAWQGRCRSRHRTRRSTPASGSSATRPRAAPAAARLRALWPRP